MDRSFKNGYGWMKISNVSKDMKSIFIHNSVFKWPSGILGSAIIDIDIELRRLTLTLESSVTDIDIVAHQFAIETENSISHSHINFKYIRNNFRSRPAPIICIICK